ncbi:GH1 family beta-glucosidase [Alphaproteobacteria bacterium]|nr:GH1 family beta-glucosidase [Alphaproteobacteria bacterium]
MDNLSVLKDFPDNFTFGAATSSYQIEGNSYGRCGKSIWDEFAQKKLKGIDGLKACNHYEYFREDIKLIKDLGFKAYRFSFAWPRLFPENNSNSNEEGVDFYNRLLDEILNNDLEPFPTLYHWDLPIRFSRIGGWENQDTCKHFADYSYFISQQFGDKFEKVATINEPWCVSWLSHYLGEHAPGKKDLKSAVLTMHNVLLAHGLSLQALKSNRPHKIGIVLNNQYAESFNQEPDNLNALRLFDEIHNRWFSDAIFKGSYPKLALEVLGNNLSKNFNEDLKIISRPLEWVGLNYYTRSIIKYKKSEDGINYQTLRGSLKKTDMDWEFYPTGLSYFIKRISNEYSNQIPIYITENGMANNDELNARNEVNDLDRVEYFHLHLQEILNCLKEGLNVKGYFAWSLLDNYEWAFGYSKRFGLVFVDFENFKRIPKKSYYEFSKFLNRN